MQAHYGVPQDPVICPCLGQMNPAHPFKIHFNYHQVKGYKNLQYFGGWLLPYLQAREDCSTSLCLTDTTEMA